MIDQLARVIFPSRTTRVQEQVERMYTMNRLSLFTWKILFSLISFRETCASLQDDHKDLATMAVLMGEFDILLDAWMTLSTTEGISNDFQKSGPMTIFAPMNVAFDVLPHGLLDCLLSQPEKISFLNSILSYHILPNEIMMSHNLTLNTNIEMLNEDTIIIQRDTNLTFHINNHSSMIVEPDILATNGVLHAINTVLIPPSMNLSAVFESCSNLFESPTIMEGRLTDSPMTTVPPFVATGTIPPGTMTPTTATTLLPTIVPTGTPTMTPTPLSSTPTTTPTVATPTPTMGPTPHLTLEMFETTPSPTLNKDTPSVNNTEEDLPWMIMNNTTTITTISEIIGNTSNLQTLATALEMTGLVTVLSDINRSFTIFAPTDIAFERFLSPYEWNDCLWTSPSKMEILTILLLHHMMEKEHLIQDLLVVSNQEVTTLSGECLSINASSSTDEQKISINGGGTILSSDIQADNGIIHLVDQVLTPPSLNIESLLNRCLETDAMSLVPSSFPTIAPNLLDIPTSLLASRSVEKFVSLWFRSELADLIAAPNGPFTLFVPSNAAIDSLPDSLNRCLLRRGSSDAMWDLLSYHVVVDGSLSQSDLEERKGSGIKTFGGDVITISSLNGTLLLNNVTPITVADFYTVNGVIHGISDVLFPPNVSSADILELCLGSSDQPTPLDPIRNGIESASTGRRESASTGRRETNTLFAMAFLSAAQLRLSILSFLD